MNKLFVCLSHTLEPDQIASLESDFGITPENIILLQNVNPELAELAKQVPADWEIEQVKELAANIFKEAKKVGATHFMCQGEPALQIWANMYASDITCIQSTTIRVAEEHPDGNGGIKKIAVFKHVKWRKLF